MTLRDRALIFLATGFGIGYIPLIPGTFGTLPGLPLCFLLAQLNTAAAAGAVAVIALVSMGIAGAGEKLLKQKDPRKIVIDEIAGLQIALFGLPFNLLAVVSGFIAFRIFDIWKPYPLRSFETRFSGGVGVVMDDLGAGVYANLLVRVILYLYGLPG